MSIQFLASSENKGTLFQEKYVFWFAIFLVDELCSFLKNNSTNINNEFENKVSFHIKEIHRKGAVTEDRLSQLELTIGKTILDFLVLNARNLTISRL